MDIDRILQQLDRFLGAKPVIADHVFFAPNAVILGFLREGGRFLTTDFTDYTD